MGRLRRKGRVLRTLKDRRPTPFDAVCAAKRKLCRAKAGVVSDEFFGEKTDELDCFNSGAGRQSL